MVKDFVKNIMEPNRLRIIQYLIRNKQGTAAQMKLFLSDIPQATLYRHLKVLEKAECIQVVKENRIRGAVEKVYSLNQYPIGENPTNAEIGQMVQMMLLQVMGDFARYFEKEGASVKEDLYGLSTCNLLLTDEEFMTLNQRMGEAVEEAMENKPKEGRKERRIMVISSPIHN